MGKTPERVPHHARIGGHLFMGGLGKTEWRFARRQNRHYFAVDSFTRKKRRYPPFVSRQANLG